MNIRHLGKNGFKVTDSLKFHTEGHFDKVRPRRSVGDFLSVTVTYDYGRQSTVKVQLQTTKSGTVVVESKDEDMYKAISKTFEILNRKLKSMDEKNNDKVNKKSISENTLDVINDIKEVEQTGEDVIEVDEILEYLDLDDAIEKFQRSNLSSLSFRDLEDGQIKNLSFDKNNNIVVKALY